MDAPTPEEALAWLKESGQAPDLTVTWRVTNEPGSAGRHLKLLKMLFEPEESEVGVILPPHG